MKLNFSKYRDSLFLLSGFLLAFLMVYLFFYFQEKQDKYYFLPFPNIGSISIATIPGPPRDEKMQFNLNSENAIKLAGRDDFENERWLDISGNAYSQKFIENFSYQNKETKVFVKVLEESDTLRGRIEARGLKPNFAYQIKLSGIYENFECFEKIGYAGRWRFPGKATNFSDNDYRKRKDKSDVEAYILFDFFVTDKNGNAVRDFALDSSLHVLWNSNRQQENENCIEFLVDASDSGAYSRPKLKPNLELIWAEREGIRYKDPMQKRFLPEGKYIADIVLTEESFHSFENDGGYWATVFKGRISFRIDNIK